MSDQIQQSMNAIPLFDGLGPAQLESVRRYLSSRSLAPGEMLFEEGDHGDYLCFVADGQLEMSKSTDDGPTVLALVGTGRSFGEMALIDDLPRSATAMAIDATDLLVLSQEKFDKLLQDQPAIGVLLLKRLARLLSLNLRRTSAQLVEFS